ncbi:hypothetical protein [Pseudonocardia sp.]|uniref:hypothetical protein n=1 Tax=Pseudonocardia sp. TaxID=60912 RepID=UPI003D103970
MILAGFLRAVADRLDGADALDRHAAEAAALLDDPAEVVIAGPDLTDNQQLQMAVHFQETRRELRRFQLMYGKASATIGHLRGRNAFLAEELLGARTTIRQARAALGLAAGESLTEAITQVRGNARTLKAKLAEKNGASDVDRDALANELLRAYTGNDRLLHGTALGWGDVADRAIAIFTGTEAHT